ncbi:MAG: 4Fe-4S binding protein [Candidatus Buchananbacteria bacterium]
MPIFVDKNQCPQNHPCPALKICPKKALSQKNFDAPIVDANKCCDCGMCVKFCPKGALRHR